MKEIVNNNYYKINVDIGKNRIYASFHGFWGELRIMEDYLTSLDKAISNVKKNFTLVADLNDFKTLPTELIPKQKLAMQMLGKAGMYRVAELLPASVISKMQVSSSAKETNMPNRQFSSIVDGEKWLDEEIKKL